MTPIHSRPRSLARFLPRSGGCGFIESRISEGDTRQTGSGRGGSSAKSISDKNFCAIAKPFASPSNRFLASFPTKLNGTKGVRRVYVESKNVQGIFIEGLSLSFFLNRFRVVKDVNREMIIRNCSRESILWVLELKKLPIFELI